MTLKAVLLAVLIILFPIKVIADILTTSEVVSSQ